MRNERYDFLYLPEQYHQRHKWCEFLLYQIEDFITKEEYKKLRIQTIEFTEENKINVGEHLLDYLIRTNNNHKHDEIITSNILNALIIDICQFLQISLFSSMQRRLTVTFALLRKPFVYDLVIILRLYFTQDFLKRFNTENGFDTTGLSQQDILTLVSMSEEALSSKSIKALDIFNFIFNQNLPDSIVNFSNKALHPSTTRNKSNLTEVQNLNFVFSSEKSIETQWEYLYNRLPLLMLYFCEVLEFIIFEHLKIEDSIYVDRLTERAEYFKLNIKVDKA